MEWVEQHEKLLSERAVIYLNIDAAVEGNFVMNMHSTPLVKDTLRKFSKTVKDPSAHDDKESIYDIAAERNPSKPKTDPHIPAVGNLGAGSDYAAFYQYVGVPAAGFCYTGYNNTPVSYPVYHTQYDTFAWLTKFIDPEFKYFKAASQLCGGLLLMFADAPLLNMSVMLYSDALNESLHTLKTQYSDELKSHSVTLGLLKDAVEKFHGAAKNFTKAK